MKYSIKYFLFSGLFALFVFPVHADEDGKNMFNPLTTGVTTLGIAPDARGGSMGDLGVATDPDVNSQYWNPSKYAFAYSSAGVSVSYTPWLRKLVNDINLAYVAGYWKFGGNDLQALSASLRYFSLGSVPTYDNNGTLQNTVNPYEMAIDLGYSRKLSSSFSMGVVFRFIYSDMGFGGLSSAEDMSGAAAFAADISGYQTVYPIIGRSECQFSWGFNISNIGSKVSYDGERTVLSCRPICVSDFRSCSLFMITIRCRSTSTPISCWFRPLLVKAITRMKTNTEIRNMTRKHIIERKTSSIIPVLFRVFSNLFPMLPAVSRRS